MKKLVVLISGNGTNLQSILEACANRYINGRVVAVISNKDTAYGLTRAKDFGVPTYVISPKEFINRNVFEQHLMKQINSYSPDLVILAGYMLILSKKFVLHYYNRVINIHPSLLPKYPGLYTHQQVLKNGDVKHGATVHFVTDKLDMGPIILQSSVPIFNTDTEEDIIMRVQHQEHIIYPLVIRWFSDERLQVYKNSILLDGKIIPPLGLQI